MEKSAESLIEQLPTAQSANLLRREKAIEQFGIFALGGLGIVGIIGIAGLLWVLITKLIFSGANPFLGVLMIAFFVFAVLSLIFVVFNESLKEKKSKVNPVFPNELSGKNTGKLLAEKSFAPIPSVTENSTELFFAENKTRKIK